jgi:N utilization substance protein B
LQALIAKTFKILVLKIHVKINLQRLRKTGMMIAIISLHCWVKLSATNEYQKLISEKTKNWESDRIALMDTLLMRMAICELVNFPSIPVKVTINEYN